MTENKRFKLLYSQLGNGMFVDREKQFEDIIVDKEFQKIGLIKLVDLLNKLSDENKELKHNNKMLSMKMSEVYTNYRLLKEFSEDTNPNDAVKKVLSELMQITKEYR